jgi:membrane fusion protein, multidrug efflux system
MYIGLKRAARRPVLAAAILSLIVAGGVYSMEAPRAVHPAAAAPPPVSAAVRTLVTQKIRAWSEFSGRLHAVESAEIRPEVGGRITEVRFEDGQSVTAGDVLFVIDPRPYEAAVARARANLASAQSNAAYAKSDLARAVDLIRAHTIAQRVYDERANASRVADADQAAAAAALNQAELDLEHAYVRAPIAGRAGRVELTVGNLVQPGAQAPLLTTIVANRPIYADFDVDEQTYIRNVRDVAAGRAEEQRIPVELSLQGDGSSRVYRGHIYSFDNRLDVTTGTIRARARFENEDGSLLPGMYVTVRLADAVERDALLVPERAIGFDQSKKYVYVVGTDNKVVYREVELGGEVRSQRIVLKGLAPGERVIIDGLQHVRPNMIVSTTEAEPAHVTQAAAER